jgi:uncharacterized protein (DUF427 family)
MPPLLRATGIRNDAVMATTLSSLLGAALDELRIEPTAKRVRAYLGDDLVAESRDAVLVWEPRRVVPGYAVPRADVVADLVEASGPAPDAPAGAGPVYPNVPFAVHTTPGTAYDVRTPGGDAERAAFAPHDADLGGRVALDDARLRWFEEDDEIGGHPRDPFHRVDVRHGTAEVRVEVDGALVAHSRRPLLVFETGLPPRYYLPREDVLLDLAPTASHSSCPYKGDASYWSLRVGDTTHDDLAWSYETPLPDAAELAGAVAFYQERADVSIGDVPAGHPRTPWS